MLYIYIKQIKLVSKNEFEELEKKHEITKGDTQAQSIELNYLKEILQKHTNINDNNQLKLKEINETLFNIDNIKLPTINTKLNLMVTQEQLNTIKKDNQNDLNNESLKIQKIFDDKINKIENDLNEKSESNNKKLNDLDDKYIQKLNNVDKVFKDQIVIEKDNNTKILNTVIGFFFEFCY
jgi:hypothetical protein